MTLAQQLVAEGEYKNKVEVILNGYNEGASIDFLAKITKLPIDKVKQIINQYRK